MRHLVYTAITICAVLSAAGCEKTAVTEQPASMQNTMTQAPTVIEGLQPLSPIVYDFALSSTQLFYSQGHGAIRGRFHPMLDTVPQTTWDSIETLTIGEADLNAIEYFGHGYGEDDDFSFTVVQLKVPLEDRYSLVKLVVASDAACCRLAGINIRPAAQEQYQLRR